MNDTNTIFVPYKKFLFLPIFVLAIFAGLVLIIWGGNTAYKELEARRDATAFSQGQYDSVLWAEFTAQDPALTHQELSAKFYNEGMMYVFQAYIAMATNTGQETSFFALAANKFQDAFLEAEGRNDFEMMSKAASAMGATLLRVGLGYENISYLEKADAMLVIALKLNPNDQNARWNLELLRRLYKPSEDPGGGDDGDDSGPGGIDPGKGGF